MCGSRPAWQKADRVKTHKLGWTCDPVLVSEFLAASADAIGHTRTVVKSASQSKDDAQRLNS